MGLPGMLGALGACFGRVVTMDSPKARPPGTFNWAATLWHELAHVITLQMSGNRLPRWLSEGISTFEETRARPGWGRESELLFAQAYAGGRLLPLADLNSGFAKVETINLAYQEASVLVAYLVETHGDEKLRAFVRSFGEGLDDEAALTRAYGRTWATLQPEFDAYVKQKYDAVVPALTEIDDTPPGPHRDGRRLGGLCRQARRQLPRADGARPRRCCASAISMRRAACSNAPPPSCRLPPARPARGGSW